jgi:hypothetical protein
LIDARGGALACREEILYGPLEEVEVVIGEGPWEKHETKMGDVQQSASLNAGRASLPMLVGAIPQPGPRGGRRFVRTISPAEDLYLDQHRMDGVPVLPAAVALELAAEAAAAMWPEWCVSEVTELRLLKGLRFENDNPIHIEILVTGSEHGDATGFNASVEIRSLGDRTQTNYRASLKLTDAVPQTESPVRLIEPKPARLSARQAYREVLFHGPCFQVIQKLVGMDASGIVAEVVESAPAALLKHARAKDRWLFDPALIDAAAQLAWLWASVHSDAVALPNRFAMVRRFSGAGPARKLVLRVIPEEKFSPQVRAEVLILDDAGRLVFAIDDLESTASPALNRLRGWSGEIRV